MVDGSVAQPVRSKININMRCIEILNFLEIVIFLLWININMRCIEITIDNLSNSRKPVININMRCIEIEL